MTNDDFLERNRRLEQTLKALHKERAEEASATEQSVIERVRSAIDDIADRLLALDRPKAAALALLIVAGVVAFGVAVAGTLFADGTSNTATKDIGFASAAVAGASSTTTTGSTSTQCVVTTTVPGAVDPNASTTASSAPFTDSSCESGTAAVPGDPMDSESATGEATGRNVTTTSRPGSSPTSAGSTPTTGGTIFEPPTTDPVINPPPPTDPPPTDPPPTDPPPTDPPPTDPPPSSEPDPPASDPPPATAAIATEPAIPPAEPAIPIPVTLPDPPVEP